MRLAWIYRERSLPIKLYSRNLALIFHTCTSTLFCVAGVMVMLVEPSWEGLGSLAFFGLCLTVFIHEHLHKTPFLRLDYGGFTRGSGRSQQQVSWAGVDCFFVANCQGQKVVGWRYLPNTREYEQLSAWRNSVSGVHGSLSYTYGKKPEHLADLMNELRLCHRLAVQYLEEPGAQYLEYSQDA